MHLVLHSTARSLVSPLCSMTHRPVYLFSGERIFNKQCIINGTPHGDLCRLRLRPQGRTSSARFGCDKHLLNPDLRSINRSSVRRCR
ncbi:hypothetical protein SKAU_G00333110 [Synaphobranchus kaupii]|uniref:Uncharacterized protein n=1 Tax=Synaphobranchus kaupii TaxID=118154 RepID=A0A9Q1ELQ1_SYNKA|nr:hypothetical protein SKAU_G00333110 [Synaphobranchus kaupii]